MDFSTILGLIARHALTTLAGILVSHGYLAESGIEQFIGAGLVFAGIAWSWWQKSGQAAVAAQLAKMKGAAKPAAVIAFALLALGALDQARAADLTARPVLKAPVFSQTACVQNYCTSWLGGLNLVNSGGNFDVIGGGLNGLASNGIEGGAQIGAEFWNGQWFAMGRLFAEYEITQNLPNAGSGNSGQWAGGAIASLGYSLANLFGAGTTGQAAPQLPGALANALISPYINLGTWRRPWGWGLASGAGVQALIATNWTLNADYIHVNYNNAAFNSNVKQQTENMFLISVNRHFAF